jgi:hypothetical protein
LRSTLLLLQENATEFDMEPIIPSSSSDVGKFAEIQFRLHPRKRSEKKKKTGQLQTKIIQVVYDNFNVTGILAEEEPNSV